MNRKHYLSRSLGRRVFLKALGLGIAAPLAFRMGRMALAEPSTAPMRLCVIFIPNGAPIEHFEPPGNAASSSKILSPLAPYESHLKVVRGLSMNDGANNHAAIRAALTGFTGGVGQGGLGTDSIDTLVAKALGVKAHTLGVVPDKWFSTDAHLVRNGAWKRPLESPAVAAETLFPTTPDEGPSDADFRAQALSLTQTQVERMRSGLTDLTREENKLAVHLDALQQLQDTPDLDSQCLTAPELPLAKATADLDVYDGNNFAALFDGQLEVTAHALLCGTARVVTLQLMYATAYTNFNFPDGPGIGGEYHNVISHASSAPARTDHASCLEWIYQRIADRLLTVLNTDDPLAPGSTVLDNTLIYVCSEVCDGQAHNSFASKQWIMGSEQYTYLPTVLIGGAGGYFNNERIVTAETKHIDMLATIADAMGTPLSTSGGQALATIPELKA